MRNMRIAFVSIAMAVPLLSGCSAYGQYCDAVESAQPQLLNFGEKSTKAFANYSTLTQEIADAAPEDVTPHWEAISVATGAVASEQRSAQIDLADMNTNSKLDSLSRDQIKSLNQAYLDFNDTQKDRKIVVADVLERCKIDLTKEKK